MATFKTTDQVIHFGSGPRWQLFFLGGYRFRRKHSADSIGQLTCLDGYMNVALEDAEEWANGKITARYGDCFVRGNNGES